MACHPKIGTKAQASSIRSVHDFRHEICGFLCAMDSDKPEPPRLPRHLRLEIFNLQVLQATVCVRLHVPLQRSLSVCAVNVISSPRSVSLSSSRRHAACSITSEEQHVSEHRSAARTAPRPLAANPIWVEKTHRLHQALLLARRDIAPASLVFQNTSTTSCARSSPQVALCPTELLGREPDVRAVLPPTCTPFTALPPVTPSRLSASPWLLARRWSCSLPQQNIFNVRLINLEHNPAVPPSDALTEGNGHLDLWFKSSRRKLDLTN